MENLNKYWCVIPVYNNCDTIQSVANNCSLFMNNILIIDDGSTDANLLELFENTKFKVIRHNTNLGKGKAIMTAIDFVNNNKGTHIITIDGDGQHFPNDLPKFIEAIDNNPTAIIIGCRDFETDNIPNKSKFGRSFSNMWLKIESGGHCSDTQSGFRAYPVSLIKQINMKGSYYDFEVEVLARAVWGGILLKDINIKVFYPQEEDRVSSFKPFLDNFRISLMHTKLVLRHLLPFPHKQLIINDKPKIDLSFIKHPIKFFKFLLLDSATPMGLAASAALGTFLAVIPLFACHTIAIIYFSTKLHLNKVLAVAIQNLYVPPFAPGLCIYIGFYLRVGTPMQFSNLTAKAIKNNVHLYLLDWAIGSIIVAPIFSLIAACIVYSFSKRILKNNVA